MYRRVGYPLRHRRIRGESRIVFPNRQRSFSPSAVFPAVIPHFCCRAVMDWPRAALLLTVTLLPSEMNQAARAKCSLALLVCAPFSESEQLGSQTRPTVLMSKPVSPLKRYVAAKSTALDAVALQRRSDAKRPAAELPCERTTASTMLGEWPFADRSSIEILQYLRLNPRCAWVGERFDQERGPAGGWL